MGVHQTLGLISVFAHCTPILLVLSCGFSPESLLFSKITFFSHNTTKTVTSWADAQTAQIVSFEILVLLMTLQVYYIIPKSPINKA